MPEFGSLASGLEVGDHVFDWRDIHVVGVVTEVYELKGTKFIPWATVRVGEDEEVQLPVTRWVKVDFENQSRAEHI